MSKISKGEWILLYIISIIIDLIQFIIDFTGVGITVNMILDPIIGALLILYFKIRGVSLTKRISRLVSILGVTSLGIITGGIASFWIVDIWYIHRDVRKEEKIQKDQEALNNNLQNRNPAIVDGRREPNHS